MKAIIVSLKEKEYLIEELIGLCHACDIEVEDIIIQDTYPQAKTYIGQGKVLEIKDLIFDQDYIIFNNELTPIQLRNLEDIWDIAVITKTDLILKIFETRASTKEAILQVKMAKLQHELPRLRGKHEAIYSQQGGSGFRGSGETQINLDKRHIQHQIVQVKKQLSQLKKQRQVQRHHRHLKTVALVGYTNSGKSSLLNLFTDKNVYVQDQLFATLETQTRLVNMKYHSFLMTDTVGFIEDLPHHLVEAFLSTLEEIKEADLLLHVVDSSNINYQDHIQTTKDVLKQLGASHIPVLYIYNKNDLENKVLIYEEPYISISVKNHDLKDIEDNIISLLYQEKRYHMILSYDQNDIYTYLYQNGKIIQIQYLDEMDMIVQLTEEEYRKYKDYIK